jgi:mono/diheme cytochrome c family protein
MSAYEAATLLPALLKAFALKHPALVHVPIGAALLLPVAAGLALRDGSHPSAWDRTCRFLACLGLAGGLGALASGLLWARQLGWVPPGRFWPEPLAPIPLRGHILFALSGLLVGLALLLWLRGPDTHRGPRRWLALLLGLAWAGTWGAAGHWGGRMVFPEGSSVSGRWTPRERFHASCTSCHGEDGSATAADGRSLKGRNLRNARWQGKVSDQRLIRSILEGRDDMPGFGATMTETEAAAIVREVVRPMAGEAPTPRGNQ